MIFNEFEKIFKANGLTEIDILNKKYDPMLCEIVATVDGEEDGKVVEIIQPGYIIDGRLLKPAKVKIIKKVDSNSNATSEPGSKAFSDSSNAGSESSEN
jgi:molecular chaperone GrpE (heat shock protein)